MRAGGPTGGGMGGTPTAGTPPAAGPGGGGAWPGFGAGTLDVEASNQDGVLGDAARIDHQHKGVRSVNGAFGDVAVDVGVTSFGGLTGAVSGDQARTAEMDAESIYIEVVATAATDIPFLGLDGEEDGDYLIEWHCVPAAPLGTNLRVQPEGVAANVESKGFFGSGGAVTGQNGGTNLLMLATAPSASGITHEGTIYLQSRTGKGPRLFISRAYGTNHEYVDMTGHWNDDTTPITKVILNGNNTGWGVGSWARLRKLKNINSTTVAGGSPPAGLIAATAEMVMLGDSIPSPVYNTFQAVYDAAAAHFGPTFAPLLNAGIASSTVQSVELRVQADVVDVVQNPANAFVIFYLGVNNISDPDLGAVLIGYGRNLDIMILGGIPPENIVCVAIVDGENVATPNPPLVTLNSGISALAAARGCVYANIWPAFAADEAIVNPGNAASGFYMIDGVHFNALGKSKMSASPTGWIWPFLAYTP